MLQVECLSSPPQFIYTNLILNVIVFGDSVLAQWLGDEGGTLRNGISIRIKRVQGALSPHLPCETTETTQPYVNQEVGSHHTWTLNIYCLTSWLYLYIYLQQPAKTKTKISLEISVGNTFLICKVQHPREVLGQARAKGEAPLLVQAVIPRT